MEKCWETSLTPKIRLENHWSGMMQVQLNLLAKYGLNTVICSPLGSTVSQNGDKRRAERLKQSHPNLKEEDGHLHFCRELCPDRAPGNTKEIHSCLSAAFWYKRFWLCQLNDFFWRLTSMHRCIWISLQLKFHLALDFTGTVVDVCI